MVVSVRRARFSLVPLDPGVLVIDVQGWGYVLRDDAGAERSWRPAADLAIEDQAHFLGATEIEVLADHLFEEQAAMHGPIEHLGQRELGLQDRDIVAIAGGPISTGERWSARSGSRASSSCEKCFSSRPKRACGTSSSRIVSVTESISALHAESAHSGKHATSVKTISPQKAR